MPLPLFNLQVYEEAGSDFHQVAYFRTRIGLRNALQEEISGSSDKEAVLITLNRPIVFAQPVAFDRGPCFFCIASLHSLINAHRGVKLPVTRVNLKKNDPNMI